MSEVWVANASPIITLAKARRLDLLTKLAGQVLVPDAVVTEVLAGPDSDPARVAMAKGWGERVSATTVPASVLEWSLGAGESQVLAVALAKRGAIALLDDAEGRRCARTLGIPLLGTLGVVLLAKKRGYVDSASKVLHDLRAAGIRLDEATIREALRRGAGEEWKP